jgi:hypothetical protein
MTNIIPAARAARPELFTSELISDRFQVLESEILRGSFFVFDHQTDDIRRAADNSTVYFDTVEAAMASISGVVTAAVKSPRQPKAPKVAKVREPKAPAEAKAPRASAHSTIVELIKTTELTDEQISAKVQEMFPGNKTTKVIDVAYRRKKVVKGEL